MRKYKFLWCMFLVGVAVAILVSCAPTGAPVIENSNGLPIDNNVYVLTGVVEGISSLVRQTSAASGVMYNGYASFSGPTVDGKSFIRLRLEKITVKTLKTASVITGTKTSAITGTKTSALTVIEPGQTLIIKVVDTKAVALFDGDRTTLLCRYQYEPLSRSSGESYDQDKLASWEFDYCRLETGAISAK